MNHDEASDCCSSVIPINAARPFKKPAHILTIPFVAKVLQERPRQRILEIGAGSLRNSRYLQDLGHSVSVLEVKGIEQRFPVQYEQFRAANGQVYYKLPASRTFDIALCTFVVETICCPDERIALLTAALGSLKHQGNLLISVRGPKDLVTAMRSGTPCGDGYLTPNHTFARAYTPKQLTAFLTSCGYNDVVILHKSTTKDPEYLHAAACKE